MNALAVLWAVLKVLGWLLLILLAVLLLLLCIPVRLTAEYRAGQLRAAAGYGPLRFTLYPPPPKAKKTKKTKKAGRTPPKPAPAAPAAPQAGTQRAQNARVQSMLAAFRAQPLAMLEALLAHVSFAGSRLLRGVHVRHLRVYWTVNAEQDAAATAVLYGAQIAALNNLLARARQVMDIEADLLRLEPDFTGELAPGRGISGEVFLRPGTAVLLVPRLLWRLCRDPELKALWQ